MNTETNETPANTSNDPKAPVFVTRTGKTYHSEFCAMGSTRSGANRAQKSKTMLRAAVRNHLAPCAFCSAPTYTGPMK